MEKVIVDCVTGKETRTALTTREETDRLAEIQVMENEENSRRAKEKRKAFLRVSVELREMKLNSLIFSIQEIADKQAELDSLR